MPIAQKYSVKPYSIIKDTKCPFGMLERSYSDSIYRFGFNGKENDNEILGNGRWQDYGERMYRPDLIRFFSPDPMFFKFPSNTLYSYAGNSPNYYKDIEGKFKYPADKDAEYRKKFPLLTKYLEKYVQKDVMSSSIIVNALIKVTDGNLTEDKIETMVTWGKGPEIRFVDEPTFPLTGGKGHYEPYGDYIELRADYAEKLEEILASDLSEEEKLTAFLPWYKTLLHEAAHAGSYEDYENVTSSPEVGQDFEREVWGKEGVYDPIGDDMYDENTSKKIIEEQKKTEKGEKTLPTIPKKEEENQY